MIICCDRGSIELKDPNYGEYATPAWAAQV